MIYDISVPVRPGMVVFPGNPDVSIQRTEAIERGDDANVSLLSFGSHTGTHVDAPKHFFDDGTGVEALALGALVGPALVVDTGDAAAVSADLLRGHDLHGEARILLRTRNSARGLLQRDRFEPDFTYLTPDGAEYLAGLGARLVGIDYLSVEQHGSDDFGAHKALLGNGVVVVEGLDLREPPAGRYELICLPVLLPGLDGSPARAILRQP